LFSYIIIISYLSIFSSAPLPTFVLPLAIFPVGHLSVEVEVLPV